MPQPLFSNSVASMYSWVLVEVRKNIASNETQSNQEEIGYRDYHAILTQYLEACFDG